METAHGRQYDLKKIKAYKQSETEHFIRSVPGNGRVLKLKLLTGLSGRGWPAILRRKSCIEVVPALFEDWLSPPLFSTSSANLTVLWRSPISANSKTIKLHFRLKYI